MQSQIEGCMYLEYLRWKLRRNAGEIILERSLRGSREARAGGKCRRCWS